MSPTSSFADLMARLKHGDQEAARAVYERFAARLVRAVQDKLAAKYSAKIDPESVVQSAFGSFFQGRAADSYPGLAGWGALWALLLTIARHKLADRIDRFKAARRDVDREVSLDDLRNRAGQCEEPVDPNPTPADEAMLAEEVELLFQSFEKDGRQPERYRRVIALYLQGYSVAAISEAIPCTQRTVWRTIEEVERRLQRRLGSREEGEKP